MDRGGSESMVQSSESAEPVKRSTERIHLRFDQVSLNISGLEILSRISFDTYNGELLALIGPNGAGKTSLLNCISGLYHPTRGEILFQGRDLARSKAHEIARAGIARTFQHAELFRHMTILQNLLVGRHTKMRRSFLSNGIFWGKTMDEEVDHREFVEKVIRFLELERFRKQAASSLPYGVQKIVGLGRALAMEPQVLLLDEPSAGMNRQEKEDLARFILRIKHETKMTMIWVEHDMQLVGDLADRIVVLNFGNKIAEGKTNDVLKDPLVIEAYLGRKASLGN
ncbi:MAG: ABC transporter ATP-binding protein [Desulfobacterales bacterium]|nr:ABC transporter ATP-binding protein [Desulfobacterales bacterium]